MKDNGIETKGIESLCETLKFNSTLIELDISGELCDISTNEYKWWIPMRMAGNNGGNEGAKALGEMFHENKSLKTLDYSRQKKGWGERQSVMIHDGKTQIPPLGWKVPRAWAKDWRQTHHWLNWTYGVSTSTSIA